MRYEDDPRFAPYSFVDSWVLGYEIEPERIVLTVDAVLSNDHPFAGPPRQGEMYRYEQIELRFDGVSELRFAESFQPPARDSAGEADYGSIGHFEVGSDGRYILQGMIFGDLDFKARDCRLTVLSRDWEN
ncbi:hypothetical protein ACPVPU_08260 [Sphingomonas sp. CJ99]